MLMALDLARQMGLSVADRGRVPVCGEVSLLPSGDLVRGNEGRAYCRLRETVCDLIAVHSPREVWIEEAIATSKRSIDTLRFLMGLQAVAEEAAASRGVPVFTAAVQTIRLQVLGNGGASKDDVLWWARDNDWRVVGDNGGDATALLAYAACCDTPPWRLTPGPNAKAARDDVFARASAEARGQARPA